jgi:drug/metabolite transporter (DMT)-like permease
VPLPHLSQFYERTMNPSSSVRSYALVTLAVASWALNFHLAVPVLKFVPPLAGATLRYAVGGAALLGLLLVGGGFSWARVRAHWVGILVVAGAGVFLFNYAFFEGLQFTSPVNATLIIGLNPVTTMLLATQMLGTRLTPRQWLGAALSLAGVLIVISKGSWDTLSSLSFSRGDLWFLLANLAFALNHVSVRRFLSGMPALETTAVTSLLGLLLLAVPAAPALMAAPYATFPFVGFWLPLLVMGILGTCLSYISWNRGLVQIGPDKAALFMNLVPVFSVLIALTYGGTVTGPQLAGGAVVLVGILVAQLGAKRKVVPQPV